jgi:N-acetyl-alpha-D-muramate 1-phosphate uridylyltransferase
MTVYKNTGQYDASNIKFTVNGLEEYKKGTTNPHFRHIDYGLSFFKREVFINQKSNTFFDLSEVFAELSLSGDLAGYEVFNRFYEVGSLQGIKDLSTYLSGERSVIQ